MSPYGNLAGDKSGSNGFKMAWGRVKGKDANVGEIIRETVLLKALSTSVCSLDWKKKDDPMQDCNNLSFVSIHG